MVTPVMYILSIMALMTVVSAMSTVVGILLFMAAVLL
jgi:hypothetical protein